MRDLHPDVASTAKEMTVKEDKAYRVRVERWQGKIEGLYSLDFIQECLDDAGNVTFSSTYSFNMTKEELQALAHGLTA
jgi:uncharacterized protein YceH (UPF0502 family)